jgi:hypothetical protein
MDFRGNRGDTQGKSYENERGKTLADAEQDGNWWI